MTLTSDRFARNARLQAAAQNSPALKKGEKDKTAVALVQQALVDLGFKMSITMAKGKPDGIYGDETVRTVSKFQSDHKLTRDGQAGKNTLHELDRLFNSPAPPPPNTPQGEPRPGIPPLTTQSILLCPHGAPIRAISTFPPAFPPQPKQLLTINDLFIILGCPFVAPNRPSPCIRAVFVISNPQLTVNGVPTLDARSVGICFSAEGIPNGPVVIAQP